MRRRMSQKCVVYGFSGILSTVCRGLSKIAVPIMEWQKKNKKLCGQRNAQKRLGGLRSC
jgi:hypothetical protein